MTLLTINTIARQAGLTVDSIQKRIRRLGVAPKTVRYNGKQGRPAKVFTSTQAADIVNGVGTRTYKTA